MNKINGLALLSREITIFFQPLLETEGSSEAVFEFFQGIGYNVEKITETDAGPINDIAAKIAEAVSSCVGELKKYWPEVVNTIESIDFPNDIQAIKIEVKELTDNSEKIIDWYHEALEPFVKIILEEQKHLVEYAKKLKELTSDAELKQALGNLPKATLNGLTWYYLRQKHPLFMPVLELLTVAQWPEIKEYGPSQGEIWVREGLVPRFNFSKLIDLFSDPAALMNEAYGFNDLNTSEKVLSASVNFFNRVEAILRVLGAQTVVGAPGWETKPEFLALPKEEQDRLKGMLTFFAPSYDAGASIGLLMTGGADNGPGIYVRPFNNFNVDQESRHWIFQFDSKLDLAGFKINNQGFAWLNPPGVGEVAAKLSLVPNPIQDDNFVIGTETRLEIGWPTLNAEFKLTNNKPDFDTSIVFPKNKIVLANTGGNDFLGNIFPESANNGKVIDFELGVGWSNLNGFYFIAGLGLDLKLLLNLRLFNIINVAWARILLKANQLELSLEANIELSRSIFQPLLADGITIDPDETNKSNITIEVSGSLDSSITGFSVSETSNCTFTKSAILNTGFTLELDEIVLDLSRAKNIPEAVADNRPADFIGVSMKKGVIGFPISWNHSDTASHGELFVENLLVGTGGVSGTIGLREKNGGNTGNKSLSIRFGEKFTVSLKAFSLRFRQNAIIESNIQGKLTIPGFKLKDAAGATIDAIDIDIHIGADGEFAVVASTEHGVTALHLENVFDFHIKSLFIGRQSNESGGRFYIGLSGDIDFLLQPPIGQFLPDKVDIKKLIIYDDGKYEFEGGTIVLPKAFELKLGPAKIGVTAIHLGSFEKEGRKYKYFGFDGGVNVNPGGVDARGKGVKFYYTVDGPYSDYNPEHKFKWFIRLESLAIDIIIPGGSDPKKAAVIIKGYLSIKDPKILPGTEEPLLTILKNATEYAGGVYISIPKFKGLEASASMRLTPQVPAFIIDLGIEISTPILLGTTGLGIYGFRAIFGKRYVATKAAADIPEDGEWWQYYKAKIDPDYKEGIQVSKFSIKEGFSIGAGVSLATSSDSGKTFSSKLFFLLSLPDVFLFQGQAQFLKDRIGLDAVPDPPFFAIIAITKKSIEAGFGINYKIPEDTGALVTVDGVTELGFFFGDSAAWYFNIGRESPDSMRIQARLFDILNMYFYFMISNQGIRAGAGISIALKKSFGPLSAELSAYLDTKGRIAFRPKQFGGALQMGGTVALKCCGFGFVVSGGATLAGEAPKPHIITGEFEVCVKVLRKERCAHFEFTWNFDKKLNEASNPVLVDVDVDGEANIADISKVAKATHMVTGETLNLAALPPKLNVATTILPPNDWIKNTELDDYRIPVDSFIDIEFKKGLNVVTASGKNLNRIGGISTPCEYIEFVPPQRGKSEQVRHEYFLEEIEIKYWDENSNNWLDYDFYNAMVPMFPATEQVGALIDPAVLQQMKWGYWQQQRPGFNNKLRILATTPLSYASKIDSLPIEDLGVNGGTILCAGTKIPKTCIVFGKEHVNKTFAANVLHANKGITFKITTKEGIVLNNPYLGVDNGLVIQPGDSVEIFFNEPMKDVDFLINSGAPSITVDYYTRARVVETITPGNRMVSDKIQATEIPINRGPVFSGGLPVFRYDLIESKTYTKEHWAAKIPYSSDKMSIDYIKITSKSCYEIPVLRDRVPITTNISCISNDEQIAQSISDLKGFIATLVKMGHFAAPSAQLNPQYATNYDGVYMGTSLYPNQNYQEQLINLTQGYISGTTLLFTISDDFGYSCNYSFEPVRPIPGFNFTNIIEVLNVTPYTTGVVAGINYSFLLTVMLVNIDGRMLEVEIIGKSCIPTAYCYDNCSTFLYRVCYLPVKDYLLNQTIPTEAAQAANTQTLLDGINKTLQPIWRPNTTFAIRIKTSDKLYEDGNTSPFKSYKLDMVYGFKTAGPVGHYHNYPINNGSTDPKVSQTNRQDFEALKHADKTDDFKLLSLKYYIDFPKCYPNADGDIMNAKPLFYKNAELRLFYLYNYVYEFYNNWQDPNAPVGNTAKPLYIAKSSLEVVVKDPEGAEIPEINAPSNTLNFVGNSIPHTPEQAGLPPININNINNDVSILNNILLNGGNPCAIPGTSYTPLAPIDISTKKTLDLKPLKLYTAQFVAKYNPLIMNPTTKIGEYAGKDYESVVHSYVFQTSKYSSFEEQVNSYILKKDSSGTILKEAVFVMNIAPIDIGIAKSVITNDEGEIPDALKLQYADPFDRLINGVLHLDYNVLHAAVFTEFNIIKSSDNPVNVLGVLIRNPEPFNPPTLPKANPNISSVEPAETLEVSKWSGNKWGKPNNYYVIHSKDRSKMFVTGRNMDFTIDQLSKLKFTFRYKLYNGVSFSDVSVVDVIIDLSLYAAK